MKIKPISLLLTSLLFMLVLCSCTKQTPNQETLQKVAHTYPKAERIDTAKIEAWRKMFQQFRSSPYASGINLKSGYWYELEKDSAYVHEDIKGQYFASVIRDSILRVFLVNPLTEMKYRRTNTIAHEGIYIFHKNGDIELKLGNSVSCEKDDKNDGTFVWAYLNRNTGLITYFFHDKPGEDDIYEITENGTIKVGDDYGADTVNNLEATSMFGEMHRTLELIRLKIAALNTKPS